MCVCVYQRQTETERSREEKMTDIRTETERSDTAMIKQRGSIVLIVQHGIMQNFARSIFGDGQYKQNYLAG